MQLRALQNGLLDVIKSREKGALHGATGYLCSIEDSKQIHVVRKIAKWWRTLHIENYCTLTACLLKLTGDLDQEVTMFYNGQSYSAYRDEVGLQFLDYISSGAKDPLVCTVANFELALIQVKLGRQVSLVQVWQYDPYPILFGLMNHSLTDVCFVAGFYEVKVFSDNPSEMFSVVCLEQDGGDERIPPSKKNGAD